MKARKSKIGDQIKRLRLKLANFIYPSRSGKAIDQIKIARLKLKEVSDGLGMDFTKLVNEVGERFSSGGHSLVSCYDQTRKEIMDGNYKKAEEEYEIDFAINALVMDGPHKGMKMVLNYCELKKCGFYQIPLGNPLACGSSDSLSVEGSSMKVITYRVKGVFKPKSPYPSHYELREYKP